MPIWARLGPRDLKHGLIVRFEGFAMDLVAEIESRFTGMIFLLRRVVKEGPDGRLRLPTGPDMGYAVRRPRRA